MHAALFSRHLLLRRSRLFRLLFFRLLLLREGIDQRQMLAIQIQQVRTEIGNLCSQILKLLFLILNLTFCSGNNMFRLQRRVLENDFGFVTCLPNGSIAQFLGAYEGIFDLILLAAILLNFCGKISTFFCICEFCSFSLATSSRSA